MQAGEGSARTIIDKRAVIVNGCVFCKGIQVKEVRRGRCDKGDAMGVGMVRTSASGLFPKRRALSASLAAGLFNNTYMKF